MIDIKQKKEKILSYLDANGPSIPVRIAKTIEMDPVFASAILSELLNTKDIRMSSMKIGSSPLYLIPGQEEKLEDHTEHLKPTEKEAYLKLKEHKIINDENEEPKIRVALRSLKDFAKPFKNNGKIIWRYAFTPEEEIFSIIEGKKEDVVKEDEIVKEDVREEVEEEVEEDKKIESKEDESKKEIEEIKNEIEPIFNKKEGLALEIQKPEFLTELIAYLEEESIELLEEIKTEKKEIVAKVRINSALGKLDFLLIAKNKMSISKEEISSAAQQGNYNQMPCLIILRKEPTKGIQTLLEDNHLINLKVMK